MDSGRRFVPVSLLKNFIDMMSYSKVCVQGGPWQIHPPHSLPHAFSCHSSWYPAAPTKHHGFITHTYTHMHATARWHNLDLDTPRPPCLCGNVLVHGR